jgi:predicted regulator of Ras-like GTPase activity (Roadblock/LC7/MglB family)
MSGFAPPSGNPIERPEPARVHDSLEGRRRPVGQTRLISLEDSMLRLIDRVVGEVPGVSGAMVSSADGLVLASRVPRRLGLDPRTIAAMSAAVLGLSNRLVQLTGRSPASFSHQRSDDAQVFVFGIGGVAVLTVLADPSANPTQVQRLGHEVVVALDQLIHLPASE